MYITGARGAQERASDPVGLEFQVVVNDPTWVLGTKCS